MVRAYIASLFDLVIDAFLRIKKNERVQSSSRQIDLHIELLQGHFLYPSYTLVLFAIYYIVYNRLLSLTYPSNFEQRQIRVGF